MPVQDSECNGTFANDAREYMAWWVQSAIDSSHIEAKTLPAWNRSRPAGLPSSSPFTSTRACHRGYTSSNIVIAANAFCERGLSEDSSSRVSSSSATELFLTLADAGVMGVRNLWCGAGVLLPREAPVLLELPLPSNSATILASNARASS